MRLTKKTLVALTVTASLFTCISLQATRSHAQTGNFAAVINEQTGFGDSLKSVTFFDADDLASGPMFSVFAGFERPSNMEDPSTIDVDPATGDVYLTAFDTGTAGNEQGASLGLDSTGDMDLLKINFATVFNHWEANFKGTDARTLGGALTLGGPVPGGSKNSLNLDYITYGVVNPFDAIFPFNAAHSNTFVLPGSVEKIGEIKRNNGGNFFPFSLEFIDQNTLLLLDDSSTSTATDTAATDHEYRIIERVSTSPGAANDAVGDHLDGGYNRGATESWNSRRIGLVNRDFAAGVPIGHSEPESTAFYDDSATGVRGVWVTESDGGGDDIAFLEIDGSGNSLGYRPHSTTGNPDSFALDNDPFVSATTNDGKADNIFVDQDTGDLIIIESGFNDSLDGIGADHEPAVIRREVITYDNGSGQIQFGAWSKKVILNPTKTPGDTGLERGQWTAYDSVNDLVYFFAPGSGSPEVPQFEFDMWVLDLKPIDGDFDGDSDVDGADFLLWQRGGSPNGATAGDLALWEANFGVSATTSFLDLDDSVSLFTGDAFGDKVDFFSLSAAAAVGSVTNAVPEPASMGLFGLGLGLIASAVRRRKRI